MYWSCSTKGITPFPPFLTRSSCMNYGNSVNRKKSLLIECFPELMKCLFPYRERPYNPYVNVYWRTIYLRNLLPFSLPPCVIWNYAVNFTGWMIMLIDPPINLIFKFGCMISLIYLYNWIGFFPLKDLWMWAPTLRAHSQTNKCLRMMMVHIIVFQIHSIWIQSIVLPLNFWALIKLCLPMRLLERK